MKNHNPTGPRVLLNGTQDAIVEAIGEARTITKLHALAIQCDDAERPYVARLIALAQTCTCGSGELQLPIIDGREKLDAAERRLLEEAQKHVGPLGQLLRTGSGFLETLRTMICRFLAAGGRMEAPVELARYRREGPKTPGTAA